MAAWSAAAWWSEAAMAGESEAFLAWWAAYACRRRVKRSAAWAEWQAQKCEGVASDIMDGLARFKLTHYWLEGYMPEAPRWLKYRRWEDEPTEDDATPARDGAFVVAQLPVRGGDWFKVTESEVTRWQAMYPDVDVPATLREQAAWLAGDVHRQRRAEDMGRFIHSWLIREQERPDETQTGGGRR